MRQVVGGDHFGAGTGHQLAKAFGELDFGEAGAFGAALAPSGAAAEGGFVQIAKINRAGLGAQQRDHLAQGEVENFVQIERLGGNDRHGIQRIQFAIAAADFVFGALLLGHIEQEALVALDLALGVAGGETALHGGEQGAVLAAQADFKVADVVVQFHFAAEHIALFGGGVKLGVHVQGQQFFAAAVSQHAHEGVIAIEQFAFRRGDENAFLHLLEEQTIFFLGDAPVGGVAHHVNGALLLASLFHVGGGGNHGEAAEAGVGAFVKTLFGMPAVGTAFPLPAIVGQHGFAELADDVGGRLVQAFQQGMIGFHHTKIGIVKQDQVVDGIEGVGPLPMGAQNLFHQAQVFDRQSQLMGGGGQKFHFVGRVGRR